MKQEGMLTVQCDAPGCNWNKQEHIDDAHKWHNQPCPECGHTPIVSDTDLLLLKLARCVLAVACLVHEHRIP